MVRNWRRGRSSGKIPPFIPPTVAEDEEVPKQEPQPYAAVPSAEQAESIHYVASPASSPGYDIGGFAQNAVRQSGTYYEGGRPFGKHTFADIGSE